MTGVQTCALPISNALKDPNIQIVTPDQFAQIPPPEGITFPAGDRFKEIAETLLTTAITADKKGVDLNTADLVLILGAGSPIAGPVAQDAGVKTTPATQTTPAGTPGGH